MFALPGLLALIFIDFVRPQEYFEFLKAFPLLYIATGLAGLGLLVDLRLGISRLRPSPHLPLMLVFVLWAILTLAVTAPGELVERVPGLLVPLAIYLLLSQALQSFRGLQLVAGLLLAIALALAAIGVHQAFAPYGCHREVLLGGQPTLVFDGRPCEVEDRWSCENEGAEPGVDYRCERAGLLGTSSIRGRVRYRGTLEDPNELSLVIGIALPFAFAFFDRRASVARLALIGVATALVGVCTYFTQSRGGQVVFLTVLAVYFVKRFGIRRGLLTGVALALPILIFGGRSGGESSTAQRTECWWIGLHLFVSSPGVGVGAGRFTEHHFLTAHNSFILAAAELGLPGLLLWTAIVYLAVKIAVQAVRTPGVAPVARTWGVALLAAMAGLLVGSFFLSFIYKNTLWMYVALTGVLYHAVKRHLPSFDVRLETRDLVTIAGIDAALLVALVGYTGSKLGW
jgi:O-antigen ligase